MRWSAASSAFSSSATRENNRWVNFAGPESLIGHFADVVVTEAKPHSLRGRLHAVPDLLSGRSTPAAAPAPQVADGASNDRARRAMGI
jgi:hypothetical protein